MGSTEETEPTQISLDDAARAIVHLQESMDTMGIEDDEFKHYWAEDLERMMDEPWVPALAAAIRKQVDRRRAQLADPDYWKPGGKS